MVSSSVCVCVCVCLCVRSNRWKGPRGGDLWWSVVCRVCVHRLLVVKWSRRWVSSFLYSLHTCTHIHTHTHTHTASILQTAPQTYCHMQPFYKKTHSHTEPSQYYTCLGLYHSDAKDREDDSSHATDPTITKLPAGNKTLTYLWSDTIHKTRTTTNWRDLTRKTMMSRLDLPTPNITKLQVLQMFSFGLENLLWWQHPATMLLNQWLCRICRNE